MSLLYTHSGSHEEIQYQANDRLHVCHPDSLGANQAEAEFPCFMKLVLPSLLGRMNDPKRSQHRDCCTAPHQPWRSEECGVECQSLIHDSLRQNIMILFFYNHFHIRSRFLLPIIPYLGTGRFLIK